MVLIERTPRLTIDNNLNGFCDLFNAFKGVEAMVEQMVQNMQLIVVHISLLKHVEHSPKKQKKTYVVCKGL
jgi:hypothetical protein